MTTIESEQQTSETWTDRNGKVWPVKVVRENHDPKLVCFGRGRTTIDFGRYRDGVTSGRAKCECYDDPEDFFACSRWWAHSWAERRDPEQFEGVPFVDMREAVSTEAGYAMVVRGPMVNVDLESGQVERLGEVSPILAGAMAGNAYGSLLGLHAQQRTAGKIGCLDSVDIQTYLAMWREAGAVVGTIRGGNFEVEASKKA